MPENTVKVDRSTPWGNPYKVERGYIAEDAVIDFELAMKPQHYADPCDKVEASLQWIREHIGELRGKNLACWCRTGNPCHADVLLRLANAKGDSR